MKVAAASTVAKAMADESSWGILDNAAGSCSSFAIHRSRAHDPSRAFDKTSWNALGVHAACYKQLKSERDCSF
jgi:hypothetical protein